MLVIAVSIVDVGVDTCAMMRCVVGAVGVVMVGRVIVVVRIVDAGVVVNICADDIDVIVDGVVAICVAGVVVYILCPFCYCLRCCL